MKDKSLCREYRGGRLIKACAKGGADVRRGKGDHVVVEYKGSHQVIPDRTLGKGLQCKILKWMISVGLAVLILVVIF